MEFEWKKSLDSPRCRFSPRSKEWCVKWSVHQNKTKEESSSCRCRMTSYGVIWRTKRFVLLIPSMWPTMQEDSLSDIGHSSGSDQKRHGTAQTLTNFADSRTESLKSWWLIFVRRTLTSKGGGKLSIHLCGDYDTIEVLFRIITSVNQLSIYGAVADLCEEFNLSQPGKPLIGTEKPSAMEKPRVTGFTCRFLERFEPTSDQATGTGEPVARSQRTSGKPLITINW